MLSKGGARNVTRHKLSDGSALVLAEVGSDGAAAPSWEAHCHGDGGADQPWPGVTDEGSSGVGPHNAAHPRSLCAQVVTSNGTSTAKAAARIQADPRVMFTEPNMIYKTLQVTPKCFDRNYLNGGMWSVYGSCSATIRTNCNNYGSGADRVWPTQTGGSGGYDGTGV